MLNEA
jgi:hypothetical protein